MGLMITAPAANTRGNLTAAGECLDDEEAVQHAIETKAMWNAMKRDPA